MQGTPRGSPRHPPPRFFRGCLSVPTSAGASRRQLVLLHQSEALWLNFDADYPFAMKVGAGKLNAVSGESWTAGLQNEPQNHLVLPEQPWLDGFAVSKGIIRQFIAMPLGDGIPSRSN